MNQEDEIMSHEARTLLQRRLVQLESMVKDLQRECHRLRKQNKRLNSETQKFKKALLIRDDLLEGMHMERQGLKIENDWLKDQLKLLDVHGDHSTSSTGAGVVRTTLNNKKRDHGKNMIVPSSGDTSDESISDLEDNPIDMVIKIPPPRTFLVPPTPVSTDESQRRARRRRRRTYRHSNILTKDHDDDSGSTSFATATDMPSVQSQKEKPSCRRPAPTRRSKSPIVSESIIAALHISSSSNYTSRPKPFDELITGRNTSNTNNASSDRHHKEDLVGERRRTVGTAGMNLVQSNKMMHTIHDTAQEYLSTRPSGTINPAVSSHISTRTSTTTTSKISRGSLLVPRRLTQNVVTFPF